MSESKRFCTFLLNGELFGFPVEIVQEVLPFQEITPVPLTSPTVAGLINLRGQILMTVDLRRKMGLADREPGRAPMNIVIRTGNHCASLLVDQIGDVLDLPPDLREEPPRTLPAAYQSLITDVYKLEQRLLLILDAEKSAKGGSTP